MPKKKKDIKEAPPNPPSKKKIIGMLSEAGVTREKICEVLAAGLKSTKAVVGDGEFIEVPDYNVRHKYVETILDVLGEKKLEIPKGELHYHFTNVLQLVAAYESGDSRAVKDASRMFEGEASSTEVVDGK